MKIYLLIIVIILNVLGIISFVMQKNYQNHWLELNKLPYAFYINLKHRKDRYDNVQQQMKWWSENRLIRIDAVKNKDGALGCGLSHIKSLKKAKEIAKLYNQSYVLILEDDFKWKFDKMKTTNILNSAIKSNIDWDVITLITCTKCGAKIDNTGNILRKISNSGSTAGYIIKIDYIDTLLNLWEKVMKIRATKNYNDKWSKHTTNIDQAWKLLQLTDNWYTTNPTLIRIIEGPSDIYENNIQDPGVGLYD
tara:strand:+ start:1363 stop:2112 length:750 start_codon:yes stop_codon:yes gene_type:complete